MEQFIFPRFHQLDVTRKLQATVLRDGAGGKYLVQHSAGSGKTNSIAWTAHFLAELHDAGNAKLFDTVLVVSDRTVIDSQLQEAVFDFERTTGVVATITNKDGSKSGKLNDLFGSETTEQDQLVYVNQVLRGKMLESETLRQQATNNTKEQFAASPDLRAELQNAIIASYDAHSAMSTKALNSPVALHGLLDILLNHSQLWESLRLRAAG